MIQREFAEKSINKALKRQKIVLLLGPRQSGKTTMARHFLDDQSANYFDLEDPASLRRIEEPMTALQDLEGLVVIDEVQRRPELFPILRVLADRKRAKARFLILGSASGQLLRQTSESLAGRIERIIIGGFGMGELGAKALHALWLRGGFPRSFLAGTDDDSFEWRRGYMQNLLERDFPQWGVRVPAMALQRFWSMLAHYHAQTWNAAEPARALGVDVKTVQRHLDLLTDAFMVRQLQPWHANLGKRQVKSPKIYIRDSGLLHQLLGLRNVRDLETHPKVGASWEGFALEQVLASVPHDEACFWATHQGAEIDLILRRGSSLYGVEFKRADAPGMTPSVRMALGDLGLEKVLVIYPGAKRYALADKVTVVPLAALARGAGLLDE